MRRGAQRVRRAFPGFDWSNRPSAARSRKVLFEPLEPRLLLSADLSFTAAIASDLTLRVQDVDGVDHLQIVLADETAPDGEIIVESHDLADLSDPTAMSSVTLTGSLEADRFTINLAGMPDPSMLTISIIDPNADAAGSGDTLVITGADGDWTVDGLDAGAVNGVSFSGIENLVGSDGTDSFTFADGASVSGSVDGGTGADTLDLSASTSGVTVDLLSGSATSVGAISSIENILTGAGDDTIIGALSATILDTGAGNDTLDFSAVTADLAITVHASGAISISDGTDTVSNVSGVENIVGGSGTNTYIFEDGASLAGTISGGSNVLDYAASSTAITVNIGAGTATGTGGVSNVVSVIGGSGSDTLTGPAADASWSITSANSGSVGGVSFTGIENLAGGSGSDSFAFADSASVTGAVTGGAGSDTLDHSASTAGITIDLSSGTATGTGGIADIESVVTGAGNDTIIGALSATILGTGDGNDTLDFSAVTAGLAITVHASGAVSISDGTSSVSNVSGVENIVGGSATNTYTFEDGAALAGTISGGSNVLNYAASTSAIAVDLGAGTASGTGGIAGVTSIIGSGGSDTLTGPAADASCSISGTNSCTVNGVSFSGIENLEGGSWEDTFSFAGGRAASVTRGDGDDYVTGVLDATALDLGLGSDTLDLSSDTGDVTVTVSSDGSVGIDDGTVNIEGITGADNVLGTSGANTYVFAAGAALAGSVNGSRVILDYSNYTSAVTVDLTTGSATGTGGVDNVVEFIGGDQADTLVGPANDATWRLDAADSGEVNGVTFVGVENLTGGDGDDTFIVAPGVTPAGVLSGGAGTCLLYTSDAADDPTLV